MPALTECSLKFESLINFRVNARFTRFVFPEAKSNAAFCRFCKVKKSSPGMLSFRYLFPRINRDASAQCVKKESRKTAFQCSCKSRFIQFL